MKIGSFFLILGLGLDRLRGVFENRFLPGIGLMSVLYFFSSRSWFRLVLGSELVFRASEKGRGYFRLLETVGFSCVDSDLEPKHFTGLCLPANLL